MERASESGHPVDPGCDDSKLTDFRPDKTLGRPGKYLITCGLCPRMLPDRPRRCASTRVSGSPSATLSAVGRMGHLSARKNLTSYQFRARRLNIGYRVESIPGRNAWRRMGSTAYRRPD